MFIVDRRLAFAVVCLSATFDVRAGDAFLPALEASEHTAGEWIAQFERDGCHSTDMLWCVHWSGDRGEAVVAALKGLHGRSTDDAKKVIETMLVDWGVDCGAWFPVESAAEPATPEGNAVKLAIGIGVSPLPLLDGDDAQVLIALHGDDVWLRARAAMTLAQRQVHIDEAVRVLIDALDAETKGTWRGSTYRWGTFFSRSDATGLALEQVRDVAGTAFDAAVIALVTDPATSDTRRRFVLRQVMLATPIDPALIDAKFLELATRPDSTGWLARARLLVTFRFSTSTWDWEPAQHERFHSERHAKPYGDLDAERVLADFLARELDRCARDGEWKQLVIENAGRIALASAIVKDVVVPRLMPLLERDDDTADEALFVLSHLNVDEDALRAAFVRRANAWLARGDTKFPRLPCLVRHDAATRAAFAALYAAAEAKSDFALGLLRGDFYGEPDDPLARDYAAWAAAHRDSDTADLAVWSPLAFDPSRFAEIPRRLQPYVFEAAADAQKMHGRSADVPIAGLMAILDTRYGESGGDGYSDYWQQGLYALARSKVVALWLVEKCLKILSTSESFDSHQDGAADVLMNVTLDRTQQARVAHAQSLGGFNWGVRRLFARQGPSAIESVPVWRDLDLRDIVLVARITRLTPAESRVVTAALLRGTAEERVKALEVVASALFVDDAWREPALARRTDQDVFVRRAALSLAATKGW